MTPPPPPYLYLFLLYNRAMAIKPRCDRCGQELSEFGGILLSPPDQKNNKKFHLCNACYTAIANANHAEVPASPHAGTAYVLPSQPYHSLAGPRSPILVLFDHLQEWAFRFGFFAVFALNGVVALVKPADFLKLLEHNFIAQALGHHQLMLYAIAANDIILGLLILLFGSKKRFILAWAGLWFLIVTFFKVTSL